NRTKWDRTICSPFGSLYVEYFEESRALGMAPCLRLLTAHSALAYLLPSLFCKVVQAGRSIGEQDYDPPETNLGPDRFQRVLGNGRELCQGARGGVRRRPTRHARDRGSV